MKRAVEQRTRILTWALMVLVAFSSAEALGRTSQQFRLTVKARDVAEQKSDKVEVGRGEVQRNVTQTCQLITLKRSDPALADVVSVEWIVILQRPNGQRTAVDSGNRDVEVPLGKEIEFETPPVTIHTQQRDMRRADVRTVGEEIAGVAVRVHGPNGVILAEEYQPRNMEKEADDWFSIWKKTQGKPGPKGPPPVKP